MPTPSEVLGVDPDADEEAIEEAYRRRVLEAHPDHGGSASEFRDVRLAYEELVGDADGRASESSSKSDGASTGDSVASGRRATPSRVEYLDYEVLADRGWSLEDPDLFERAAAADLGTAAHGEVTVGPTESLLEAAERAGLTWPYACRGGACANCAVAVLAGELSTPATHILPREMLERGIRLSCVGRPVTRDARVVVNVKHLPDLDDLRLPPYPFERARREE